MELFKAGVKRVPRERTFIRRKAKKIDTRSCLMPIIFYFYLLPLTSCFKILNIDTAIDATIYIQAVICT